MCSVKRKKSGPPFYRSACTCDTLVSLSEVLSRFDFRQSCIKTSIIKTRRQRPVTKVVGATSSEGFLYTVSPWLSASGSSSLVSAEVGTGRSKSWLDPKFSRPHQIVAGPQNLAVFLTLWSMDFEKKLVNLMPLDVRF